MATINADTFLHCIGGSGSSHHSSSSKDDKDEGGSAFGTFVTWFCVLIGLGVDDMFVLIRYFTLLGKEKLVQLNYEHIIGELFALAGAGVGGGAGGGGLQK